MQMRLSAVQDFWRDYKVAICFGLLFAFAVIISVTVGLSDDEAYYWSWSLEPDISYFDHPPLLAWTIWATTHIFGKNSFAVRLPALLSFLATSYLFVKGSERSNIPWRIALSLCISAPISFLFSWMTLPDVLFLPLSLLTIDSVIQKRFSLAGTFLGLAILSKWHAILIVPGVVFMIFRSDINRKEKLGAALKVLSFSFVFQLPVIVWNCQHNYVSLRYHLVDRISQAWSTPFITFSRGLGFGLSFLVFGGSVFIYLLYRLLTRPANPLRLDRKDINLIVFAAPFLAIFGLAALKGETRVYWAGFALFPAAILCFRHTVSEYEKTTGPLIERIAVITSISLMLLLGTVIYLPIGAYARPVVEVFGRYDLRLSPRGGMIGWKKWAKSEMSKEKTTLYLTSDFRIASQLLWVSELGIDRIFPIHPDHQFSIWKKPELANFTRIVFVGDDRLALNPDVFKEFCLDPAPLSKTFFDIRLQGRVVKKIETMTCDSVKVDSASRFANDD